MWAILWIFSFFFLRKLNMLHPEIINFGSRNLPDSPKIVKIGPQRPPGDPQMAKIEPQRASGDAHDHRKDPPRAPKAST